MTNAMPPQAKTRSPVVAFVLDLTERAVKTAAQTALATFGAGAVNLWHIPWHEAAGVTAGATIVSVLTSLASVGVGNSGTASLVK